MLCVIFWCLFIFNLKFTKFHNFKCISVSSFLLFLFSFFLSISSFPFSPFLLFPTFSLCILYFLPFLKIINKKNNKIFNILKQSANNVDYRNKELSATTSIIISKIVALIVGLACVAVAFLAQYLGGLLQVCKLCF